MPVYRGIVSSLAVDSSTEPPSVLFRLVKEGSVSLWIDYKLGRDPELADGVYVEVAGGPADDDTVIASGLRIYPHGPPKRKPVEEPVVVLEGVPGKIDRSCGDGEPVRFWLVPVDGEPTRVQIPAGFATSLEAGKRIAVSGSFDDEGVLRATSVNSKGAEAAQAVTVAPGSVTLRGRAQQLEASVSNKGFTQFWLSPEDGAPRIAMEAKQSLLKGISEDSLVDAVGVSDDERVVHCSRIQLVRDKPPPKTAWWVWVLSLVAIILIALMYQKFIQKP